MEEIIDTNPEIKTYKAEEGRLILEKTHITPIVKKETFNIEEIQEEITKYRNVIAQWQAKIDPLEAIIAKYNELKPVPEVIPEEMEK